MPKVADQYLSVDPWLIVENGFHADRSRVSEAIFSSANEYMGVRGYFDEGYGGDRHVGSYINGVYEARKIPKSYKGISTSGNYMLNTLDWLYTRVSVGSETLDLNSSRYSAFQRTLDMRTGVVTREFVWHPKAGGKLKVKFERFISMHSAKLGGQRVSFESLDFKGTVKVVFGLDFDTFHESSNNANFWDVEKVSQGPLPAILARTQTTSKRVFSGFRLLGARPGAAKAWREGKKVGQSLSFSLAPGKSERFEKLVVNEARFADSATPAKAWSQGEKLLRELSLGGFDAAVDLHRAYWDRLWSTLDCTIEGDPENQQGLRYCIFQLHQTYHGADPQANIGAKGLTGEFYNGHTFWDTEAYCLNFYLFNNPAAAKNLLLYRYHHLPQAKARAKEIDCEGACFPFATINGEEDCGLWWIANTEIHVGLAVFYAIWHYVKISGDKAFLYKEGAELLVELSRFYASRGQYGQKSGKFGLYGVMGPDEFKLMVNHNCYMNLLMKMTFETTAQTLTEMSKRDPAGLRALTKKLKLKPTEKADWLKKAAQTLVLQDKASGVFEQNEGFFDMPHKELKTIPVKDFPLYHSWSYDRLYRYDMHKQPDVLLFLFFFNRRFSPKVKKSNYDYYAPRCIHESSLSPAIHSILASEIGYHEQAYEFAQYASRLDLDNYNRNTREGLHTTSLSAAWMNLVYGFGGMRSDGELLSFEPSIPRKWKSYSYRVLYRKSVLEVRVDKKAVRLRTVLGPEVSVVVYGAKHSLDAGGVTVALPASRRA
ncbi:MAG TPA: glycosyl hydrolase family 65 protein [bacterium]|jgi:maltose phosphorylase|nr:glycosyl hydrolase family 65 protein [bacterium]